MSERAVEAMRERLAEAFYLDTQGDDRRVSWEREKQIKKPYSLAPYCYRLADVAIEFLRVEGCVVGCAVHRPASGNSGGRGSSPQRRSAQQPTKGDGDA